MSMTGKLAQTQSCPPHLHTHSRDQYWCTQGLQPSKYITSITLQNFHSYYAILHWNKLHNWQGRSLCRLCNLWCPSITHFEPVGPYPVNWGVSYMASFFCHFLHTISSHLRADAFAALSFSRLTAKVAWLVGEFLVATCWYLVVSTCAIVHYFVPCATT